VRLAELVAVLSLASDLGMGQPMEHARRQCLIALRLGDELDLEQDQRDSLLRDMSGLTPLRRRDGQLPVHRSLEHDGLAMTRAHGCAWVDR
jgi:hypothetical protein